MKLSKSFVQISSTAIITSAIYIIYFLFFSGAPTLSFMKSDRITWPEATQLKTEYINYKPLRVTHKGQSTTDPEKTADLQGFVFDAAHLNEIINNNQSASGNPDKVIFYLGQDGKAGGLFTKHGIIHIIAVGIKGDILLIDDKSGANLPSIFDKADPCPPFCPK